jgi:putative transcriptional regulator
LCCSWPKIQRLATKWSELAAVESCAWLVAAKARVEDTARSPSTALAVARGKAKPAKWHVPTEIDVRAIRTSLHLSQEDFAAWFGFTINQIREWEQGRARPLGGVRAYLMLIEREPRTIQKLLRAAIAKRAA